jgi:hypothetical protein
LYGRDGNKSTTAAKAKGREDEKEVAGKRTRDNASNVRNENDGTKSKDEGKYSDKP